MRSKGFASVALVALLFVFGREPQETDDPTLASNNCVSGKVTWWNSEVGWAIATDDTGLGTPIPIPAYITPEAGRRVTNCGEGWE